MPFFSVIIPLYNKESFILEAVASVLAQSFDDFDIIIVDDCSTDNSLQVVQNIVSDKIKIINHQKNSGLSASRNTGIKASESLYMTFLDADDLWKPNFLETIKNLIDKYPESKIYATNYIELYPNNVYILPKNNIPVTEDCILEDFFLYNLGQPLYHPCSVCISRMIFNNIGFYDETITYGEDVDFNIRMNLKYKIAYSPTPLMVYRMFSENQITNTALKNKVITDFQKYEKEAMTNPSLKKYLDFNRYIMCKIYKHENDIMNFNKLFSEIDTKNLNKKQLLLLKCPIFILNLLKQIKSILIKYNLKPVSF